MYFFFFNVTATTEIYTYLHTLSLPDALPIAFVQEQAHAPLTLLHHAADLRRGDRDLHHDRRRHRLSGAAGLAISRYRPADGDGDGELSRRHRADRRRDGGGADRADRTSTRLNSSH